MKKQAIIGLMVMIMLIGLVGSAQADTTFITPTDGDTISGNYTLNVTTDLTCAWVSFNYSIGHTNITWYNISTNHTEGTVFTAYWNTTELCSGNYTLNATSNRTVNQGYVNITTNNNVITLVTPIDSETINSGNYTFNATTTVERLYVNFSWSNDSGVTWTEFASNDTAGTVFTAVWNTTGLIDGTYDFNASTNCTILDNRTEVDQADDVVIDNVAAAAVVDSPEFSTIMIAGLIGLLSATAILLRNKKK